MEIGGNLLSSFEVKTVQENVSRWKPSLFVLFIDTIFFQLTL
jgi:hypothetical protein